MERHLNSSASIFLAAVMHHLTAKVLGLAGNKAQNSGQRHITPELVALRWKKSHDKPRQCIKKQRRHSARKLRLVKARVFSSSLVWI